MPHHIVIVEDEPVTQARLQSYFTQEVYTVSVTASGAGLRETLERATPTQCSLVGTGAGRNWDCDWHCADCIATRWDQSHQHNRILCQLPQYATGV